MGFTPLFFYLAHDGHDRRHGFASLGAIRVKCFKRFQFFLDPLGQLPLLAFRKFLKRRFDFRNRAHGVKIGKHPSFAKAANPAPNPAVTAPASGHLASFDRRKVRGPLNGPKATGQHAREGWTFYTETLPQMKGVTHPGSAEASYYTWVDQFNTLGLGRNVPINTGNESEGLLVLKDGKFVVLRVPYPLGFYTKWMDGRIDNPNTDWKGRGVWACIITRAPFHGEGGKGATSRVMRFQLRPDPMAR